MSKTTKSQLGKKKLTRNILICAVVALVIAAAILLIALTQRDSAGMNCFQRRATVASADGVTVSMSEYKLTYDMIVSNYQSSYGMTSFTEDEIRSLQENAAKQALMVKIYAKEAKALGITLTQEQQDAAKKTAQNQIDSIRAYYTESLADNGNYSKATVEKQIVNYYQQLGMSENAYFKYLKESAEESYYASAMETYFEENHIEIDENDLQAFYRKSVEDSMYTTEADGTKTPTYSDGQFWNYLMLYSMGYSTPMLYVPEGFIYVDFIELEKGTAEEVEELIRKVTEGEMTFDELKDSEDNVDTFKGLLEGAYAIAENDHGSLFAPQELYTKAAALGIGEIDSFVGQPQTDDNGNTTVTGYLVRRAQGDMCIEGDSGVIKMDYFPGIRESAESQYRLDQWLSDIKYEDAIYAYRGALK